MVIRRCGDPDNPSSQLKTRFQPCCFRVKAGVLKLVGLFLTTVARQKCRVCGLERAEEEQVSSDEIQNPEVRQLASGFFLSAKSRRCFEIHGWFRLAAFFAFLAAWLPGAAALADAVGC
jgi:hypothetical protein